MTRVEKVELELGPEDLDEDGKMGEAAELKLRKALQERLGPLGFTAEKNKALVDQMVAEFKGMNPALASLRNVQKVLADLGETLQGISPIITCAAQHLSGPPQKIYVLGALHEQLSLALLLVEGAAERIKHVLTMGEDGCKACELEAHAHGKPAGQA